MNDSPDPIAPREELPPVSEIHGFEDAESHACEEAEDESELDFAPVPVRYRDPARYGRWIDRTEARQHADGPVLILVYRLLRLARATWAAFHAALDGLAPPEPEGERVDLCSNASPEN